MSVIVNFAFFKKKTDVMTAYHSAARFSNNTHMHTVFRWVTQFFLSDEFRLAFSRNG